jgi:thiol:disulfide interchange protein DsbA
MQLRRLTVLALLVIATPAFAQLRWHEGVEYTSIASPQLAGAPGGKIEVAEVFSYGCPYCNRARGDMAKLAASLPPDAAMTYVHASFRPDEGWLVFQRAYYAARQLGIADATHEAMFQAIWETGEMPLMDLASGKLRNPLPTLDSAAKFYAAHSKVKAVDFLKAANSAETSAAMARADALIKQWRVSGTPSLVVNGRYLVNNDVSFTEQAQIVKYLIGLERNRLNKK